MKGGFWRMEAPAAVFLSVFVAALAVMAVLSPDEVNDTVDRLITGVLLLAASIVLLAVAVIGFAVSRHRAERRAQSARTEALARMDAMARANAMGQHPSVSNVRAIERRP